MNEKPNIILITVDSMRADHLGCYGYHRPTSPNMDALAQEGVLCERLFCQGIPTYPSYTTLYTGQHPITHGVVAHGGDAKLKSDAPFLPQLFTEAGYTTCAVDNMLRGRSWFGRGYEFYIDPSIRHHLLYLNVTCDEINNRAIPWIKTHSNEPFFMFLHYWDPHWPFIPPKQYLNLFYQGNPTDTNNHSLDGFYRHPIGEIARDTWLRTDDGPITDAEYVIALYDQEIRYLDNAVGELIGTLDDLGLSQQTMVVLLADHGESMTEHGIFFDHHGLYDSTLHIPLIVRWPGILPSGLRLPQFIHQTDIAPTILEAAGLTIPEAMEGYSALNLLKNNTQEDKHQRVISAECTWQAKWSLRTDCYKFILAREPDFLGNPPRELYDLVADPNEKHNIIEERKEVASAFEEELESWIAERLRILEKPMDPIIENGASMLETWQAQIAKGGIF